MKRGGVGGSGGTGERLQRVLKITHSILEVLPFLVYCNSQERERKREFNGPSARIKESERDSSYLGDDKF